MKIKKSIKDFIINMKINRIFKLEKKYGDIEEKLSEKMSKVDHRYRKIVEKENSTVPVVCPFCNQFIEIKGGRVASCSFCEFSIGLSTISDQQDEYILYHSIWVEGNSVIVRKISKRELFRGRYIRATILNEILKDRDVVELGELWKKGITIKNNNIKT